MKFSDHIDAQKMIASVREALSDLPGAEVVSLELKEYASLKQRTERVKFKLPNGLNLEFYVETKLEEKAGA